MNKVTVIVPVYNSEEYIGRCLQSILNQTYNNFEILVVNDGSKDNSLKIIKEYENKILKLKENINPLRLGGDDAK